MMKRVLILVIAVAFTATMSCDESDKPSASADSPERVAESRETVEGNANNRERYDVVSSKEGVNVGETKTVEFAIKPAGGLKINHDYPWKVTFADTEGVEVASKTVDRSKIDLADDAATIPVQLRANAEGAHKLAATGSFSVCNDAKCYVMRDEAVEFELAAQKAPETDEQNGDN